MSEFKKELKDDVLNKETGLTERDEYFLSVLYDEAGGDIVRAMDLAGYSKDTSPSAVRAKFKDRIVEASRAYLAAHTGKAVHSLVGVLNDPTAPGSKVLVGAVKEILDRGGVFKEEKPPQSVEHNVFILPSKDNSDE